MQWQPWTAVLLRLFRTHQHRIALGLHVSFCVCDLILFFLFYFNWFAVIRTRRHKRQVVNGTKIVNFKNCLASNKEDIFKYVREGDCYDVADAWDIRCKMIPTLSECFYYATCKKMPLSYDWNCTTVHLGSANPACCDFVCQEKPTEQATILPDQ